VFGLRCVGWRRFLQLLALCADPPHLEVCIDDAAELAHGVGDTQTV
jgi:hypothetical protein